MTRVETADAVDEQSRLAGLLAAQCAWRGIDLTPAELLDALGMAGLVLAAHDDQLVLNPATVAAILDVSDAPVSAGSLADVVLLDDYRPHRH